MSFQIEGRQNFHLSSCLWIIPGICRLSTRNLSSFDPESVVLRSATSPLKTGPRRPLKNKIKNKIKTRVKAKRPVDKILTAQNLHISLFIFRACRQFSCARFLTMLLGLNFGSVTEGISFQKNPDRPVVIFFSIC